MWNGIKSGKKRSHVVFLVLFFVVVILDVILYLYYALNYVKT